jgi:hypothetical protein
VTRPAGTRTGRGRRGNALAALFAADPEAAVLRVLETASEAQTASEALTAGEIKQALVTAGVSRPDADRAWPAIQRRIKANPRVVAAAGRYRIEPPTETTVAPDLVAAARERQAGIDAIRALAELAIEVEELATNQASTRAMIHRVRAQAVRAGLEPIARAGDETTFDAQRHTPLGAAIRVGTKVVVVRPGYVWRTPTEEVLIAKAVVSVDGSGSSGSGRRRD